VKVRLFNSQRTLDTRRRGASKGRREAIEDSAKIDFEKKKEKAEAMFLKQSQENFEENIEKSVCSTNNNRNRKGDSRKNLELEEITGYEGEVLEKLAEIFNAGLSNPMRIKMLDYCLTERSFSDIMITLRLNPASLKHHQDLLRATGLIEKTGKGKSTRYKTTHLGELLLKFIRDVLNAARMT
jgi:predicted transcriptional regulator